ncbi:thiamine phosphate synthase [Litoribacter ruber]|uniref:thiamine phosphate synthase n=1 Tax=Litoribacter ruber TaxID=702568 RepID=UPI001BDADD96|nr:thiamine phosphate synthase [Litoribacter ruber]MBT0812518.1 thiamine phosphate synthase [Litoribacter ruber]
MDFADFPFRLYLVTDQKACLGRDFFWVMEEAIKGGVEIIQLREKDLATPAFTEKALRLKEICSKYNVPLIINDNVEVAKSVEATGLHIGQKDESLQQVKSLLGSHYPVGLSLEQASELTKAGSEFAWYYGVSPIFTTPTKADTYTEWGLNGLQNLRQMTSKPLVAIGNIKVSNAESVIRAGADCLAVVSGICSDPSPAKAAEEFRNQIEKSIS